MTEPTTPTGKELWPILTWRRVAILAIEREAAAAERERLRRVLGRVTTWWPEHPSGRGRRHLVKRSDVYALLADPEDER